MFPTRRTIAGSRPIPGPARRTRSAALIAIALLVLGAVASPTPISAASTSKTLEGTLELVHGEDFATGKATYDYHVTVPAAHVSIANGELSGPLGADGKPPVSADGQTRTWNWSCSERPSCAVSSLTSKTSRQVSPGMRSTRTSAKCRPAGSGPTSIVRWKG